MKVNGRLRQWQLPLLFLFFLVALSSCYQFDPIRDKMNRRDYGREETTKPPREKPDPTPTPSDGGETPAPDPTPEEHPEPVDPNEGLIFKRFSFEEWGRDSKNAYDIVLSDGVAGYWESSDPGYYLVPGARAPYPMNLLEQGYEGKGVRLITKKGFQLFGFGSYVVAGTLFTGSQDVGKQASNPLRYTYFGKPIEAIPLRLEGKYRYKAGPMMYNKGGYEQPNEPKDRAAISIVFFEVSSSDDVLNGENMYTSPMVVASALLKLDDTEGEAWQSFSLELRIAPDKAREIDLEHKKYKLSISFSSSDRGDQFLGAYDSQFDIDELVLTLTKDKKKLK